ncbi:heterokaryon incompatibility domain-containing protein [Trichoderma sp. SZMC 28012]
MDAEIRRLVCDYCWSTLFSVEGFKAAWESSLSGDTEPGLGYTYTTATWQEIERSINFMCSWCEILQEEISHYYHITKSERDAWGAITNYAGEPPPDARFRCTIRFGRHTSSGSLPTLDIFIGKFKCPSKTVYAEPGNSAAEFIKERGILKKQDSPEAYTLALQCIQECGSNHPRCLPPTRETLPTRVIDCTDPSKPHLFITQSAPSDYYVALSYVWGEAQPHRTIKATLSPYTEGIDTKYIPKTIRDAIKVTHSLGLRYLWVDAFCIIQDSDEDKAIEISRIRSIFRKAYVTIIAANADRVSKGFLNPRVLYNSPCELPFRCPGGSIGTMFVQPFEDGPKEPVNTRAWCLEERVLSARALWYCSHTLQYECQMGHKNVGSYQNMADSQDGIPRLPDRIFTPALSTLSQISATEADKEVSKAWRNVLGLYSKRTLTKSHDRLIALSGIVAYFADFWPTSTYLAGLWEHQLPCCLLWYIESSDTAPRPSKYRAPSWSWAAVDGSVDSSTSWSTLQSCTVVHCQVVPKRDVNIYGEVISGVLDLYVIVRLVIWDPIDGEMFEIAGGPEAIPDDSGPDRGEIGYVVRDAIEEASSAKGEVYAAVIAGSDSTFLGIILVPTAEDNNSMTYRRVGWFTAPYADRRVWLSILPERIQII